MKLIPKAPPAGGAFGSLVKEFAKRVKKEYNIQ